MTILSGPGTAPSGLLGRRTEGDPLERVRQVAAGMEEGDLRGELVADHFAAAIEAADQPAQPSGPGGRA